MFLGDVDLEGATVNLGTVESGFGRLSLFGRSHLHETKAFRASGIAVGDKVDRGHLTVLLEESLKARFGRFVTEVAYVQFC